MTLKDIRRFIAFFIPVLVLLCGVVMGVPDFPGLEWGRAIDYGSLAIRGLLCGLLLFPVYVWIAKLLVQGGASFSHEMTLVYGVALLGFPILGGGAAGWLNSALDSAPATIHAVEVIRKFESGLKTKGHHVIVKSWRTDRTSVELDGEDLYSRVTPGRSLIELTTKPGFFGFEWVVAYRVQLPSESPRQAREPIEERPGSHGTRPEALKP